MKVLVTGGAGFIGSHFILALLKERSDVSVINVDQLTYAAKLEHLQAVENDDRYQFVRADVTDQRKMIQLVTEQHVDAIVHFAAESHVDRSIAHTSPFIRTNVQGTDALLQAALSGDVKRFIQVSTDEVYGTLTREDEALFTERSPLQPNNPYAASKASADLLVRAYHQTYGLPVCITRCSNNYGPHQHEEKLIPTLIKKAMNNEPLPLYGDGQNIRDWLYVEDHVQGILKVLEYGKPGEVYNIGGYNELTNQTIAEKIVEAFQLPISQIHYVEDRKGHDRRYAIQADKIERELGWKATTDFDRAFQHTIDWYVGVNR
ncbi:dTDP-glucose 4,6-dehydratase [Geomicrobium sp. JCM 19039]|uniref:dTDP-glucose 4,6-dehydratase n=1 Tax=Geomicrobium sp. JCM 19039 TaxID=1460636 RepID=UPI00045F35FB|nr:dTDP-glucose 4,6-dehydratase [Geomicrobium sp. JCM 19039]GAK10664.1 dTDP-glucose 4,6-dehydratase [Geomicrobium sp. JCM 19039]